MRRGTNAHANDAEKRQQEYWRRTLKRYGAFVSEADAPHLPASQRVCASCYRAGGIVRSRFWEGHWCMDCVERLTQCRQRVIQAGGVSAVRHRTYRITTVGDAYLAERKQVAW